MVTVIPVDEFASDEGYPGFEPDDDRAPWYVDPVRRFRPDDEQELWFLDFHWPRGLTPMGLIFNQDGYTWSTQLAAEQLPLPTGRGLTCRMGGTHTYGSAIGVDDPREIGQRARRLEHSLPGLLRDFGPAWGRMRDEIDQGWDYFRSVDHSALSLTDLRENLIQARRYLKRTAEIHFQVMYPLLANYAGFYSMCTELGLDPGQIGKFLQGYDTKIMETDRELWRLTTAARAAGLESVFARHEADQLRAALAARGGSASTWLMTFDDFLQVYGWRTEGSCDIALPSWNEDPTPALGMIKSFLQKDTVHDFDKARNAAIEERETAVDAARSTLTLDEQKLFDGGLASCRAANFPWWQDDHNYYIDLRISLPMRWACQGIADRIGVDHQDDTLYLFWEEIMDVSAGRQPYDEIPQPGRAAQAVLRLLAGPPPVPAQGGRHDPGIGERPDPDRDLRPEQPLPARRRGGRVRQRGQDPDRRPRLQGHRPRPRPGPAQRRRPAPAQPRRRAGVRVDLAELDPGVRQDRRLRLRRRRHPVPRRHRRPRVPRAHRHRHRPGHGSDLRRRRRGSRRQHRPGNRATSRRCAAGPLRGRRDVTLTRLQGRADH